MNDEGQTTKGMDKATAPTLRLQFQCDAYAINVSGEASVEAVNFAIAALETFKKSYFDETAPSRNEVKAT